MPLKGSPLHSFVWLPSEISEAGPLKARDLVMCGITDVKACLKCPHNEWGAKMNLLENQWLLSNPHVLTRVRVPRVGCSIYGCIKNLSSKYCCSPAVLLSREHGALHLPSSRQQQSQGHPLHTAVVASQDTAPLLCQGWQRMLSSTGTEILFFLTWASSLRSLARSDEPGGLWQRAMFITSGARLLFQVKIPQHKEFLWYLTFTVHFGSWTHFCLISKTGF